MFDTAKPNARMPVFVACLAVALCSTPTPGQILRLTSASGRTGGGVRLDLILDSPSDRRTLALEWVFQIPAAPFRDLNENAVAPSGPDRSSKQLTCAVSTRTSDYVALRCVLAGGDGPVPDGKVATIRLRISDSAKPGPTRVLVEDALGVSSDLRELNVHGSEATVTITAGPSRIHPGTFVP